MFNSGNCATPFTMPVAPACGNMGGGMGGWGNDWIALAILALIFGDGWGMGGMGGMGMFLPFMMMNGGWGGFGGNGGSRGQSGNMGGSGMSGGQSSGGSSGGNSGGSRGYEEYQRGYSEGRVEGYNQGRNDGRNSQSRDYREGRSGTSRRGYMETKEMNKDNSPESKQKRMKDLEAYTKELTEDVVEMVENASPEERALLRQKLQVLTQKVG